MIGKLFQMDHVLVTSLTEEEIFKKLGDHSVGGSLDDNRIKIYFRSKFNLKQHEFKLLQVFDYGPHNQIRPEIIGLTKPGEDEVTVNLKIRLPKDLEILLDFAIIFNIGFLVAIAFIPWPEDIPKLFFYIGLPIAMLAFYLISKLFFDAKSSDCITIIERITNAK